MGTRADFYVGVGVDAEWIGSIAWDGYHIPEAISGARSIEEFREAVGAFLEKRDDATKVEMGWPWPWEDSSTTDYSYAFDGVAVYASTFGSAWWLASDPEKKQNGGKAVFPDMTAVQKVTMGKRSGVMVFGI